MNDASQTSANPQLTANDARRAARNVGALIVASLFSKGTLFLWQIVLGPWLGPQDYGVYNTVLALLAIGASLASFSMGLIVIREVAREPQRIGAYWSAMLLTQTLLGALAYVGVVLSAALMGEGDTLIAFTAVAGLSLLLDLFGNIGHDLLLSQERMVSTSLVEIGHIVLRIGLALALLTAGYGLLGVYLAAILSSIGRMAVLNVLVWRTGARPTWPVAWDVLRDLLLNSAPLAAAAFLSLVYQHTDKLMTTTIIGVEGTGYLGPAFMINFGMIELLSTTVLVSVYPLMSRAAAHGGETFGFMVEKLARFMLMGALPLALVLSLFAEPIILATFGAAYAPTAGILRILIWYTLLTMVGNVLSKALLIQNRQRWLLLLRLASLSLNIGLNAWLLTQFRDPRGAAVASVVAEGLLLALLIGSFQASGFDWGRVWRGAQRVLLWGALAAAIMLLCGLINPWLGMASGLLVYAWGVLRGGALLADDWDLLYRLVAAMPGGALVRRYWRRDVAIHW